MCHRKTITDKLLEIIEMIGANDSRSYLTSSRKTVVNPLLRTTATKYGVGDVDQVGQVGIARVGDTEGLGTGFAVSKIFR